jgi:hypothetical protein
MNVKLISILIGMSLLTPCSAWAQEIVPSIPKHLRQPGQYVERLTGEAAKRHLDNLRARHPGLFERAARVLRQRGYAETGRVEVLRSNRLVRNTRQQSSPYRKAETQYGDEGEITYWYWNDSDYDTGRQHPHSGLRDR